MSVQRLETTVPRHLAVPSRNKEGVSLWLSCCSRNSTGGHQDERWSAVSISGQMVSGWTLGITV